MNLDAVKDRIQKLDKNIFFILSTARCRSTWFGNFFTYKDSFCWNEESRYYTNWDEMVDLIEKRPEKNVGFEDPELLHYISTLYELFPNAKYVFLERDRKECEISISRWIHPNIMDSIEPKFDRWYEDIDKMNRLIPNIKKINFYDMNEIDEIKSIWDYVLPDVDFDIDRFNTLAGMVISITYADIPKEVTKGCMAAYFDFNKLDQIA